MPLSKGNNQVKGIYLGNIKIPKVYKGSVHIFSASINSSVSANQIQVGDGASYTCIISLSNGIKFGNLGIISKNNSNLTIGAQTINSSGQLVFIINGITPGTSILSFSGFKNEKGIKLNITNSFTIQILSIKILTHPTLSQGLTSVYLFENNFSPTVGTVSGTNNGGSFNYYGKFGYAYQNTARNRPMLAFSGLTIPKGSVNCWFKMSEWIGTYYYQLIFTGGDVGRNSLYVYIKHDGTDYYINVVSNNNTLIKYPIGGIWTPGLWYMLTITISGTLNFYINGVLVANSGSIPSYLFYNGLIMLGLNGDSYESRALIDHFMTWDKALSLSEISDLYNNGNGRDYS